MTNKKVNLNKKDIQIKKLQEEIKHLKETVKGLKTSLVEENLQFCELNAKYNILDNNYKQSKKMVSKIGKLYDIKTEELETLREFYQMVSELEEMTD